MIEHKQIGQAMRLAQRAVTAAHRLIAQATKIGLEPTRRRRRRAKAEKAAAPKPRTRKPRRPGPSVASEEE